LAKKLIDIEVPQSVLSDTVFEVVVKIPYDTQIKEVIANGKEKPLNVRVILILPEGFQLAFPDHILPEINKKRNLYFQIYYPDKKKIL